MRTNQIITLLLFISLFVSCKGNSPKKSEVSRQGANNLRWETENVSSFKKNTLDIYLLNNNKDDNPNHQSLSQWEEFPIIDTSSCGWHIIARVLDNEKLIPHHEMLFHNNSLYVYASFQGQVVVPTKSYEFKDFEDIKTVGDFFPIVFYEITGINDSLFSIRVAFNEIDTCYRFEYNLCWDNKGSFSFEKINLPDLDPDE